MAGDQYGKRKKKKKGKGGGKGKGGEPIDPEQGPYRAPAPDTKGDEATAVKIGELKTRYEEAAASAALVTEQLALTNINLKEQLDFQDDLVSRRRSEIDAAIALLKTGVKLKDSELIRLGLAEDETKLKELNLKTTEDIVTALAEQEKSLRLTNRYYNQIDTSTQKIAGNLGLAYKWENSFAKAAWKTRKTSEGIADTKERIMTSLTGLLDPMEIGWTLATKWASEMFAFNKEVYNANINLNKATGMAKRFEGHIAASSHDFYLFGMTLEDAAKATGALAEVFSEFTVMSQDQQVSLTKMTTRFSAIGITTEDFSTSLTVLTRNMGMSVTGAQELNKELITYANSIGVAPAKFMKEFALTIPKLSVYGDRAINIFRELELRSKATGISIEGLTSITGKMDTFEGAAEVAGRLNAALGGSYFDSLELLMADENERLDIIRETINASGLQFNQLGRYEKRMLANAAGIESAAEMQRLLNGETSRFTETQKSFNEVTEASVSIGNSLNVIWKSFVGELSFAIKPLDQFLKSMIKSEEGARFLGLGIAAVTLALGVALLAGATFTATFGAIFIAITAVIGAIIWLSDELEKISKVGFENLTGEEQGKVKGGGAMAGAVTGAALGTLIGGPVGTVIGGVVGGIAGYMTPQYMHEGGNSLGGPTVLQQGEMLTNLDSGTSVIPAAKTSSIFAELTKSINELRNEIKQNSTANRQPIPVILKSSDDRVLAKTVIKNLDYQA